MKIVHSSKTWGFYEPQAITTQKILLILFLRLFYGAVSIWAIQHQMLKGSGHGLTVIVSQHLPEGLKETIKILSKDSWWLSQIQTEQCPNIRIERYRNTKWLGW
jgi:hypothetical protein